MQHQRIDYQDSDAWLLLAIVIAANKGTADLVSIVAVGDGINHAIFTEDEIVTGLRRLIEGGFVEAVRGSFKPTRLIMDHYPEISRTNKSLVKQIDPIRQFLVKPRASGTNDPQKNFELQRDQISQAIKLYLTEPESFLKRGFD